MATMSVRSTYTLDTETAQLIKQLAANWRVSQAEVVRRAVRIAARQETAMPTPAEVVQHYCNHAPPRTWQETRDFIQELRVQRKEDDIHRTAWHET